MKPIRLGDYTFRDNSWATGATVVALVAGISSRFFKQPWLRGGLMATTLASGATAAFFGERATRKWRKGPKPIPPFVPPTVESVRDHARSLGLEWTPGDLSTRDAVKAEMGRICENYLEGKWPKIESVAAYRDSGVVDQLDAQIKWCSVFEDLLLLELSMMEDPSPEAIGRHVGGQGNSEYRDYFCLTTCYNMCREQQYEADGYSRPPREPNAAIVQRYFTEGTKEAGWRVLFNRWCDDVAGLHPHMRHSDGEYDKRYKRWAIRDDDPINYRNGNDTQPS
jgi:hypothetical protein